MTKILSISDGILINKGNVQQAIVISTTNSGGSNSMSITCPTTSDTVALFMIDGRDLGYSLIGLFQTNNSLNATVFSGSATVYVSSKKVTVSNVGWYSLGTLIDFCGNSWS